MPYVLRPIAVFVALSAAVLVTHRDAQTLDPHSAIDNGYFIDSVALWDFGAAEGVTFAWSREDRDGFRRSGSAQIIIPAGLATNPSAAQCRAIPASATSFAITGSILYPADNAASNAWVQASFFDGAGCTGEYLGSFGGSVHEAQQDWFDISNSGAIPATSVSVEVRFGLLSDTGSPALSANFDNLRLALDQMFVQKVVVPLLARD